MICVLTAALKGQDILAQGNALGIEALYLQALKGCDIVRCARGFWIEVGPWVFSMSRPFRAK